MATASLTLLRALSDRRRAASRATLLITASLTATLASPATAGARGWDARRLGASFLPRLTVGASLQHIEEAGFSGCAIVAFAQLSWPLDAAATRTDAAALAERRRASLGREHTASRIGALSHRRARLAASPPSVDAQLALEETDAELDALGEELP